MPGTSSIGGLASGLNTEEIISKLVELERVPINRLKARKAEFNNKLTAWQDANTRLLALKIKALSLASGTVFFSRTVNVSDSTAVSATAGNGADISSYSIYVNKLAQTSQWISQGYEDTTSATVGTGTLTINVGTDNPVVVTIDSTNNTLNGLRDAINRSGADVSASIINTGAASSPYKLLITSKQSGESRAVTIEVNLSGGTAPVFTESQAAQDAELQLGTGASAITIKHPDNSVENVLPGVILNLHKADPNKLITVSVSQDTEGVKKAIVDFADQYNSFVDFMREQSTYDAEQKKAGTLFADFRLQMIDSDLRSIISSPVVNLNQNFKTLSAIGIRQDPTGRLVVNSAELTRNIETNIISLRKIFAANCECSSSQIVYLGSTAATKNSPSSGYAVEITRAATQARVTAGVGQVSTLAQAETILINDIPVALQAGWTQSQVIAAINAKTSQHGVVASATGADGTGTGNYLTLKSVAYGSGVRLRVQGSIPNHSPLYNTNGFGSLTVSSSSPKGESNLGTGSIGLDEPTYARLTAGKPQNQNLSSDQTITINGVEIQLYAGMTQNDVIAAINARTSEHGVVASATGSNGTGSGNYLTLTQVTAGSSAHISVTSSISNGGTAPIYNTNGFGNIAVSELSPIGEGSLGNGVAGQDASASRVTAGTPQTSPLAANQNIIINGITVELSAGMTQSQVIDAINALTSEHHVIASATDSNGQGVGNYLTLRHESIGSSYSVTVQSSVSSQASVNNTSGFGSLEVSDSAPVGEGAKGTGASGQDVAGTINGEEAIGKGQTLTGKEGNPNTDGLSLRVLASSAGSYGTVVFTKGIARLLDEKLGFLTDTKGALTEAQNSLTSQMNNIDRLIADYEERVAMREERIRKQFTAMESALQKLQSQGTWLSQQITLMRNNFSNNNR